MGKHGTEIERQKPTFEGQSAEEFIKRWDGKIDIEIRVCGKTTERRESVDYFEAREIWHDGWIGRGYAALITVDGHRLETLPQIKTFFGFRRDSL